MCKSDLQSCRGCGKPTYLTTHCSERCFNQRRLLAKAESRGSFAQTLPFICWTASLVFLVLAAFGLLNQ
jgi:hypothetical protein